MTNGMWRSDAQAPTTGKTETLTVRTQLVVLDTIVTGKNDKPVSNLKRDDFRVFQDGIEQEVRYFEMVSPKPFAPMKPATDHNGKPDWGDATRTIIVMDELSSPFDERQYMRTEVEHYLKSQSSALPGPTMLVYVNEFGFHPMGPYTRDQKELLRELAKHVPALPTALMRGDQEGLMARTFSVLEQIAAANRSERGRKVVLWAGRAFPALDLSDAPDNITELVHEATRHTVNMLMDSRVTVYKPDPSPPPPTPAITDSADGTNMSTTIDTVTTPNDPTEGSFGAFVTQTGGKIFYNRNDVDQEVAEGIADGFTYYALAYSPNTPIDSKEYHNIRVVMRDPKLHARTKSGFYKPGDDRFRPESKELAFDLYEAAVSGMNYEGVGLNVDQCQHEADTNVRCMLHVDVASLPFSVTANGDRESVLAAVMVALDAKGKMIAKSGKLFTDRIPANDTRPLNTGHITIPFDGVIPPNTQTVRVVVRSSSGNIGTTDLSRELYAAPAATKP